MRQLTLEISINLKVKIAWTLVHLKSKSGHSNVKRFTVEHVIVFKSRLKFCVIKITLNLFLCLISSSNKLYFLFCLRITKFHVNKSKEFILCKMLIQTNVTL